MRSLEAIDSELRALAAYRRVSRCSVRVIDQLLDERLAASREGWLLGGELHRDRHPLA
ncbi:hypothetical protein KD930_gp32 [Mycobacterium phage Kevin1]|uniref:Uncharacterized protein n=1 Tax=Mycobacterium phage Kevin1 TaxID=2530132 RepID=A0A481VTS4_9CAUD|nr:hypothetical protein KD930_gp32 [Mycobacterium phage Kevin1]QBI97276.1 hypothetical protein SEA_KEVIN1_32 [Mycobacterium phage Kevin1]